MARTADPKLYSFRPLARRKVAGEVVVGSVCLAIPHSSTDTRSVVGVGHYS
jgi:hypothetical protein